MEGTEKRLKRSEWRNKDTEFLVKLITKNETMLQHLPVMDIVFLAYMYEDFNRWIKSNHRWELVFAQLEHTMKASLTRLKTVKRVSDNSRMNCLAWYFAYLLQRQVQGYKVSLGDNFVLQENIPIVHKQRKGEMVKVKIWSNVRMILVSAPEDVLDMLEGKLDIPLTQRSLTGRTWEYEFYSDISDFMHQLAKVYATLMESGWYVPVTVYSDTLGVRIMCVANTK